MAILPAAPGPQRQAALYIGAGPTPIPTDIDALRLRAQAMLSAEAFAYADGSAGAGSTAAANRAALDRWHIRPRVARDVSEATVATTLFGRALPAPLLLAPLGALELAHPDADLAFARACASAGVPMIFSTQASVAMESIAAAMDDAPRWFQLYWSRSDELNASFVARAEMCGCAAIVITLDTPLLGWRPADLDLAHLPFARGMGIAQYVSDPVFRRLLSASPEDDKGAAARLFLKLFSNPGFSWTGLARLRTMTRLPIIAKGVTHPDDARIAIDHGVDGIIVSNHGGRQVDGEVAAIDALDEIAPIVASQVPLLFDSGVRGGADMFRALALGAQAVLIGRPAFNALAVGGEAGVAALLANLIADFDLTMRIAGYTSPDAIDRTAIRHV